MSKNAVHTSPDLFEPDKTNVFDPASTEMIGQIQSTKEGDITISTCNMQLSMFEGRSQAYAHLKRVKRQRVKKYVHPWDARMKPKIIKTFNNENT